MLVFITAIHVLLCVFMIFVILLQPGKDAGMGSALGGGAATSAFGGRGAVTFLSKVTAACAVLFFLTSLGLSFVGLKPSVAEVPEDENAAATIDAGTPMSATDLAGAAAQQPVSPAPPITSPAAPVRTLPAAPLKLAPSGAAPIKASPAPANPAPAAKPSPPPAKPAD